MGAIRHWMAALQGYVANRDPRAELAAKVALVVALNQPFYPVYFYWAVSPAFLPSCLTFLSTPFFAAVPIVMKQSTLFGRVLLLLAGIGNTLLCRVVFGPESGVEVFLFPCLVLCGLLFRRHERVYVLAFAALAFAVYLLPDGMLPTPLHPYAEQEYAALRRLNFLSAAGLSVMIPILFFGPDNPTPQSEEIRRDPASVHRREKEGSVP